MTKITPNTDGFKEALQGYEGNIATMLPITALKRLGKGLTPDAQEALNSAVDALAENYFFVGELLFENKGTLSKKLGNQLPFITPLLEKLGMNIGALQNWNLNEHLKEQHTTPLPNEHGTARRDKMRSELEKLFKLDNLPEFLQTRSSGSLDGKSNFVITFNLNAAGQQHVQEQALDADKLTAAVNGSAKRVIRRAFLESEESKTPTDSPKAIKRIDGKNSTKIEIIDNTITVTIPLTRKVNGAFQDGDLDKALITAAIQKEVEMALRLVPHMQ